jgi:hypothetical protein
MQAHCSLALLEAAMTVVGPAHNRAAGGRRRMKFERTTRLRRVVATAATMACVPFLVLALGLLAPGSASAQASSSAERLAGEIRSVLPGAVVTVPDPNGRDISFEGQTRSVGIGSVNAACAQGAAICDAAIHGYAQRAAAFMLDAAPMKRDQLRIVVRSRAYLDELRVQTNSSAGFVSEPLAGDLVSVCYRDLPTARRPIMPQDLTALELDQPGALALCKSNARRALAPLASRWNALPPQGIGYIRTGDDVTGYLAALEDWRPLAKQLGGLIVAAPSVDTLLYARGSSAIDVDALARLAEQFRAQASVPVSAQVLRWTEHGWVPVDAH